MRRPPKSSTSLLVVLALVIGAMSTSAVRAEPIETGTPVDRVLGPVQVAVGTDGNDIGVGWRSTAIRFPSRRTGASLHGVLFVPDPAPEPAAPSPAVVIAPGSGGLTEAGFRWAGRSLAEAGYIALTVDPQGVGRSDALGEPACGLPGDDDPRPCPGVPFQQAANYVDAIVSALDALEGELVASHAPVATGSLGVAGHSLSARAAGWLQGEDERIRAVVAWDNLASDLHGDEGSASGSRTTSSFVDGDLPGPPVPVSPRVPALGMANGSAGSTTPHDRDPDIKKAGFAVWREADVASVELVFSWANHGSWWEPVPGDGDERDHQLRVFAHHTTAWFDRWLRGDTGAIGRMFDTEVDGVALADELSTSFRSAAHVDGMDCGDLHACAGVVG